MVGIWWRWPNLLNTSPAKVKISASLTIWGTALTGFTIRMAYDGTIEQCGARGRLKMFWQKRLRAIRGFVARATAIAGACLLVGACGVQKTSLIEWIRQMVPVGDIGMMAMYQSPYSDSEHSTMMQTQWFMP